MIIRCSDETCGWEQGLFRRDGTTMTAFNMSHETSTSSDEYSETDMGIDMHTQFNRYKKSRRRNLKASYEALRRIVPAFKGGRVRASKIQILMKTSKFISAARRRNDAKLAEIEIMKSENLLLEEHIGVLRKALDTGNFEEAHKVIAQRANMTIHIERESAHSDSDWEDYESTDSVDSTNSVDSTDFVDSTNSVDSTDDDHNPTMSNSESSYSIDSTDDDHNPTMSNSESSYSIDSTDDYNSTTSNNESLDGEVF